MVKILIVEDDDAVANLIYKSLTDEGYHCKCAFDGAQGSDYIEKEKFDLVLLSRILIWYCLTLCFLKYMDMSCLSI